MKALLYERTSVTAAARHSGGFLNVSSIRRWSGYLLLAVVLVAGFIFSVRNTTPVPLDLFFFRLPELSIALWVLAAFALGGVIGVAVSSVALIRCRHQIAQLRHRFDKQRLEIERLRVADIRSVPGKGISKT